jgi:hypothetical protein
LLACRVRGHKWIEPTSLTVCGRCNALKSADGKQELPPPPYSRYPPEGVRVNDIVLFVIAFILGCLFYAVVGPF